MSAIIAFFVFSALVYAQDNAYELKEILDMRGSSSESVLKDKGYHLEKVNKSSAGIYQQWWNSRRKKCVTVRLEDGRVRSVVNTDKFDCGITSSSSSSRSHHYSDDDDLDFSDFRGMSEARASSRLQDKGYRVKKQFGTSIISMYWYKERADKCLLMMVRDDNVTSLTKMSNSRMCEGSSSSNSYNNDHDYSYESNKRYYTGNKRYHDVKGWNATEAYSKLRSRGFHEEKEHRSGDKTYRLWKDTSTGQCIKTISEHKKITEVFASKNCSY